MKPLCPTHNCPMIFLHGCGWDYDRWICGVSGCCEEIELESTTLPSDFEKLESDTHEKENS